MGLDEYGGAHRDVLFVNVLKAKSWGVDRGLGVEMAAEKIDNMLNVALRLHETAHVRERSEKVA